MTVPKRCVSRLSSYLIWKRVISPICYTPQVQINHTCNVARLIGEEAARRSIKAYVRLQQPWYETPDKGLHEEKEDIKPQGVIGTWWHESLRILGAIEGCVRFICFEATCDLVLASILLSCASASFMDRTLTSV
jgi:hypothetical protein